MLARYSADTWPGPAPGSSPPEPPFSIRGYLVHEGLRRATVTLAAGAAAYVAAHSDALKGWGVSVSVDPNVLAAAALAALEFLRDYACHKWPLAQKLLD